MGIKNQNIRRVLLVIVILLFIGVAFTPSINAATKKRNIYSKDEDESTKNQNYTIHSEIIIDGNDDLTQENGIIDGSGTEEDPYLISGWEIDGSFQYQLDSYRKFYIFFIPILIYLIYGNIESAITIKNTDKYIKISDNNLIDWREPYENPDHRAITLSNTENILIENNIIGNCNVGISCDSQTTIRNNTFDDTEGEIYDVSISGSGTIFENNIFYDCNGGINGGSHNTIRNNKFYSTLGYRGYVITLGSHTIVENNIIDNCNGGVYCGSQNTIRNNTFDATEGGIDTIFISGDGNVVENNIFKDCNNDYGIHFLYATDTIIRNNSFTNMANGYTIIGAYGLVENNELDNCEIAIKVENTIVQKNLVKSSTIGIGVAGPNCYIANNNIIGNSVGIGCYWPPDNNPIISSNIISGNNDGIYCIENSQPLVHNNNIFGNSGGLSYNGGHNINATSNWWGASDGPSGAGPGSGDSISNDVDYDPWLTSPNPDAGR